MGAEPEYVAAIEEVREDATIALARAVARAGWVAAEVVVGQRLWILERDDGGACKVGPIPL